MQHRTHYWQPGNSFWHRDLRSPKRNPASSTAASMEVGLSITTMMQMDPSSVYIERHGPQTTPALVLVHGAPDRSTSFRGVLQYHADRRVVVYDRRGYGRSLHTPPARTMIDHANDLLAILENCLEVSQAPPVVVAHSFGSNISMLAATIRPSAFAAIGLWEPPLPWVDWWSESTKRYNAAVAGSHEPAEDIEAMYRGLLGDRTWNRLPPRVRAQRRARGTSVPG